jgi:hypothetical protein
MARIRLGSGQVEVEVEVEVRRDACLCLSYLVRRLAFQRTCSPLVQKVHRASGIPGGLVG